MKKNKIYIYAAIVVAVIILIWFFSRTKSSGIETIKVPVKFGKFQINVTTTGELEAKNSEKILGPSNLRTVRIWQLTIEDIIPDGTVVDSGEYVATLDRTELSNRIKDVETDLEKLESQYIKTQFDTAMELRNARNELINLEYNLEEINIELEQSIYEPPSTIRQIKISLDKAQRSLEQATSNYILKYKKAKATMQEVAATKTKTERNYQQMLDVLAQFTVKAPKSGMVIYRRGWDGKKQAVGSQISAWDPVVATLPNLKEMISKTYVNEIDISKVKEGQKVEIGIDAFPEKSYTGIVNEVANIGEQMRNSNAKVFEVTIEVNEYDSILRPAMTTKNTIITDIIDSVLFIPIESIHNNDSLSFVYTSNSKKHVITGKSNENEIIIRAGLEKDEKIFLAAPENANDYKLSTLDTSIVNKFKRLDEIPEKKPETDTIQEFLKKTKGGNFPAEMKNLSKDKSQKVMKKQGGKSERQGDKSKGKRGK